MKALVGIDAPFAGEEALRWVARMGFPGLELQMVHAVELPPFAMMPLAAPHVFPVPDVAESLRRAGDEALEKAAAVARGLGVSATTKILGGSAASVLVDEADAFGADLVAVRNVHEGVEAVLLGSVARAVLAHSHCSLLVAKGPAPGDDRDLTAVLATDHSEYMGRCLDKLLSQPPAGLAEVTVVTANPIHDYAAALVAYDLPALQPDLTEAMEERLRERTEAVCERFRQAGIRANARVVGETPNEAIADALEETGADLLILGAQGHGFFDRLLLGSVSHHQVTHTAKTALVLRVPR